MKWFLLPLHLSCLQEVASIPFHAVQVHTVYPEETLRRTDLFMLLMFIFDLPCRNFDLSFLCVMSTSNFPALRVEKRFCVCHSSWKPGRQTSTWLLVKIQNQSESLSSFGLSCRICEATLSFLLYFFTLFSVFISIKPAVVQWLARSPHSTGRQCLVIFWVLLLLTMLLHA